MTDICPEVSRRNPWWIPKHRYYELKHYCLQYPEWVTAKSRLSGVRSSFLYDISQEMHNRHSPTEEDVEKREKYSRNIDIVKLAASKADTELSTWIIKGVTQGLSFDTLFTVYEIPCSRGTYYDRYRKFFWILDKLK